MLVNDKNGKKIVGQNPRPTRHVTVYRGLGEKAQLGVVQAGQYCAKQEGRKFFTHTLNPILSLCLRHFRSDPSRI